MHLVICPHLLLWPQHVCIQHLSVQRKNNESQIPTRLSNLSVYLQFHNCWLSWSYFQRAPNATHENQPGRSCESPQPHSSCSSSRPPDLLLTVHSLVLYTSAWLYCHKSALPPSYLNPQPLCRSAQAVMYLNSFASKEGVSKKKTIENTDEVEIWVFTAKIDLHSKWSSLTAILKKHGRRKFFQQPQTHCKKILKLLYVP